MMMMLLFGIIGLMIDLMVSIFASIIKICFYLSPLVILYLILRPRY